MFVVGVGILAAIGALTVFAGIYSDIQSEKQYNLLYDQGLYIQNEIIQAVSVKHGYSRRFILPNDLEQYKYSAELNGRVLILNTSKQRVNLIIPEVYGIIVIGENKITNANGTVCINC